MALGPIANFNGEHRVEAILSFSLLKPLYYTEGLIIVFRSHKHPLSLIYKYLTICGSLVRRDLSIPFVIALAYLQNMYIALWFTLFCYRLQIRILS